MFAYVSKLLSVVYERYLCQCLLWQAYFPSLVRPLDETNILVVINLGTLCTKDI